MYMSTVIQFPGTSAKKDPAEGDIYRWPWLVLDGLPFVDPAPPRRTDGRLGTRNCWNDTSTESGVDNYKRGERYAEMTLSAMRAARVKKYDNLSRVIGAIALSDVLESMVRDAVTRQKNGGSGSRTIITSAMSGFLSVLTRDIAGVQD
jgi:hypothetical protein